MRKTLTIIAMLSMASSLFAAISTPAATVNLTKTTVITTDELNSRVKQYQDLYAQAGQDPTSIQPIQVLDVMINDELFRQGAVRDGVNVSDVDVDNQIKSMQTQYVQSGVSLEEFNQAAIKQYGSLEKFKQNIKDQMIVQQYLMLKKGSELSQLPNVNDSEINDVYRRNKTTFVQPENVKISHIFIPFDKSESGSKDNEHKALLDQVAKDIKSGKTTFEAAVSTYSQDDGSKERAGDIGWLTTEDSSAVQMLGQGFIDQAFSTEVGKTSDVIVSNQGYHIVKILAHGDAKFLALNDKLGPDSNATVYDYIKQTLQQQKQQQAIQKAESDIIQELRSQARIKVLYK